MSDDTFARPSRLDTLRRAPRHELTSRRPQGSRFVRVDPSRRIDEAPLPEPAKGLVRQVVRRTRLWRSERVEVADELIAHFVDGLADGETAERLVGSFGDERRAAKLIRRAKRRNRPLAWHAMVFLRRLVVAVVVAYLLVAAYFYIGRPTPRVDYLAQFNQHVAAIPEDRRAWPLYRRALIAAGLRPYAYETRVPTSPDGGY